MSVRPPSPSPSPSFSHPTTLLCFFLLLLLCTMTTGGIAVNTTTIPDCPSFTCSSVPDISDPLRIPHHSSEPPFPAGGSNDLIMGVPSFLLVCLLFFLSLRHYKKFRDSLIFWNKKPRNAQIVEASSARSGSLAPKQYEYSELGQGNYGIVLKSKLLAGRSTAVKVLSNFTGNGNSIGNGNESVKMHPNPGSTAMQWISVYDVWPPTKQRFHYNITDARFPQHVVKGNEDGLKISCVASSANLWAFIMDAGTGFSSQIYELSHVFLPKDWIMKQWRKKFSISAIAGATNGSSLVVMSKGSRYTNQSYIVHGSFPFKWISKMWKLGFHVTSMATAGSKWAVVMSKKSGYSDQVVELDSHYPSERIRLWWESGYRITCIAATSDQVAFIMCKLKRKPVDETQEILCTPAFPSNHFYKKWTENLYMTSVCYGHV